jgi:DNA-binding NarL/FixJ family response regulator
VGIGQWYCLCPQSPLRRHIDYRRDRISGLEVPFWNSNRALCEATTESFLDDPASVAARPFVERTAPILDFTPSQKRLLAAALHGAETTELAEALCRTPAAIKRTWTGIFEKFIRHNPALLPATEGSLRGQQKRHKVMTYIRAHPEEMRPFPPQRVG